MSGIDRGGQLQQLRKELSKSSVEVLLESDIVERALAAIADMPGSKDVLDYLSLALVLSRQLRPAFTATNPPPHLTDLVHKHLSPSLQHDGTLARVIKEALGSEIKPQQSRSTDVLAALGKLSDVLPQPSTSGSTPTNILVPLLLDTIRSGLNTKSNLLIINNLISHVPTDAIPKSLLPDLIGEMYAADLGSYRGAIITELLVRRLSQRGEAKADEREELQVLLPLFAPTKSPATITNANRYLLPNLFAARPSTVQILLSLLSEKGQTAQDSDAIFSAWISVASLGVSLGRLQVFDLPKEQLEQAMVNADPDVRLQAFKLVTGSRTASSEETLSLVQESLEWNAVLPSAGSRSELSSAFHAFLARLKMSETAIARNTTARDSTSDTDRPNHLAYFHRWFLHDFVDTGLANAQRPPVVRALLALNLLAVYVDVYSTSVQVDVFTAERVSALLACQASEFTEVRNRARGILAAARIPLPGYETLDSPSAKALLSSALSSISHPRKVQAEAGKAALCILFERLVRKSADELQDESIVFVTRLVNQLEDHIAASEKDLVRGIEEYPLHGVIAALQDVISCIAISTVASQTAWTPIFHRIFSLIQRVWTVTRQVISLSSNTLSPNSDGQGRAEHEIARAYEVIGGEDGGAEDDGGGDHTGLLSGCWRATSQAGDLLATIISLPFTQSGSQQVIWSTDEVDAAGRCFLTWLHEVRHRGTFSKIAVAFANVVAAIKPFSAVSNLRDAWLEVELQVIADENISTTRRSAALPYSVLAIVAGDQILLDRAFARLIDLARIDTASTDITKVHAFNILKIVLLDTRQTKLFGRYFERAVITALEAFASPNWNVRNVGLILFSTLVHRSLTPNRGNPNFFQSRAALATRYTLHQWSSKHPALIPHLRGHLRSAKHGQTGGHSPLFPILIILRSLRWSEEGKELADALRGEIGPFMGSKDWQVRAVAAQAYSSLFSPQDALELAQTIQRSDTNLNAMHGNCLLRLYLISGVIDWSTITIKEKERLELSVLSSLQASENLSIQTAAIDCVKAYMQMTKCSPSFRSSITGYLMSDDTSLTKRRQAGRGLLDEAESQPHLSLDGSEETALSSLGDRTSEDERLSCLQYLSTSDAPISGGTMSRLLALGLASPSGTAVQIAALNVICGKAVAQRQSQVEVAVVDKLSDMVANSKCVPLREVALNALGWAVSSALSDDIDVGKSVETLVLRLSDASNVDQSQPSRMAALQALSHLTPVLYNSSGQVLSTSMLGRLHQLVIRLLQDDDEEIRDGAAEIVHRGMRSAKGICQAKALELEWQWIGQYLTEDHGIIKWMIDVCADQSAFDDNLVQLTGTTTSTKDVLFEVEQPNIFRDLLIDISYAAEILSTRPPSMTSNLLSSISTQGKRLSTALATCPPLSPIDQAFDARHILLRRQEAQARLRRKE